MLDIRFIRDHPDLVKEGIRKKGEADNVDELLAADAQLRGLLQKGEALKNRRNVVSEEIGKLKRDKKDASSAIGEMETVKSQTKSIDEELRQVEETVNRLLLLLPNIPHPSVPVGTKPADNLEIARWGQPPVIDFKPLTHWELIEKLGIIDFDRGS